MHKLVVFSVLLAAFFFNLNSGFAQVPDVGLVYMSGKVVNEQRKGMPAFILVYKNGLKMEEFPTSKIGKFEFSMPLQDSVAFVVYAEGYVSKTIFLDAHVPLKSQKSDYNFPFFIDLYPVGSTPSAIDIKRPIGKVIFSGTQFIYDIEFTKQQNERLKEFVRERRDLRIREYKE